MMPISHRRKEATSMLVLSRKTGERIRILTPKGEVIWVTIVDVDRGKVRVGIEAPRDIVVHREELIRSEDHRTT